MIFSSLPVKLSLYKFLSLCIRRRRFYPVCSLKGSLYCHEALSTWEVNLTPVSEGCAVWCNAAKSGAIGSESENGTQDKKDGLSATITHLKSLFDFLF